MSFEIEGHVVDHDEFNDFVEWLTYDEVLYMLSDSSDFKELYQDFLEEKA